MEHRPILLQLDVAELALRCHEQTERYYKGVENDPAYCYELMRRCFVEKDQRAWDLVYSQYKAQLIRWTVRHPQFSLAGLEADDCMQRVFLRLFRVITPEKFGQFPSLAAVLRYMQMTVNSVIMDAVRAAQHQQWFNTIDGEGEDLPRSAFTGAEATWTDHDRQRWWALIAAKLHDERELVIIRASFVLAMKPAEILKTYPQLFHGIDEIYRTKQNVLERLSRDADLTEFRDDA
ncbi:MAG: RNA polymerase sigma factor [Anaerolineales bacterium]